MFSTGVEDNPAAVAGGLDRSCQAGWPQHTGELVGSWLAMSYWELSSDIGITKPFTFMTLQTGM